MEDKKIIDLINDAVIKTKTELFTIIDILNNKIEAQDIVIKELKSQIMFNKDQIDDLDNTISEVTDRLNI
jgi:CTP:phosphocholine cytidylyltransferase-like protein